MSTEAPNVEVAEEAIEKLNELKIVDKETTKSPRVRISDEERRRIWEEKQAKKPVLETGVTGTVKWYSVRGKYGFISRGEDQKDVFVHQTAILKSPINRFFLRTLADEEEVVFDIVDGDKGPEAANVTGPDGTEVKGSRYFHVLIRRNGGRREKKPEKKHEEKPVDEKDEKEEDEEKPKKKRRPNRPRKQRKDKKKAEGDESEEKTEEVEEKAGGRRRRSSEDEKNLEQTNLSPNKASGDVSLGGQPAASAAVH